MSTAEAPIVDDPPSGRFTWTIETFSRITKKLYSDIFYVGGYKWYVNICPYIYILVVHIVICVYDCLILLVLTSGPD